MKSLSQSGTSRLHFRRLDECCTLVMGQSPPGESYSTEPVGMPFFQGKADFGPLHPQARVWCSNPLRIAEKEDILICVRAPVGPVNVADQRCCIGRGLAAVRPRDGMDGGYLYWWLRNSEVQLQTLGSGSTFQSIGRTVLATFGIPVPPLADQQRIAAKLDEQMAALDRAEKALAEQQTAAVAFKRATVHAALDPASHPYFGRVTLRSVCDVFNGYAFDAAEFSTDSGTPLIRIRDLKTNTPCVNYVGEFGAEYLVAPGSLLIGMDGEFRCYKWKGPRALLNQRVCWLKPAESRLVKGYLLYVIDDHLRAIEKETTSTTVKHVSSRQIGDIVFACPPLPEQRHIAERLDESLGQIDSLAVSLDHQTAFLASLRTALLDTAFCGEA